MNATKRQAAGVAARIRAIEAAGYRVEVEHRRIDHVQHDALTRHKVKARDAVNHMLTLAEFAAIGRAGEAPVTTQIAGRGGATFVRIIPSGPGGLVVDAAVTGRAVCRLTDNFCRATGVATALGRAVGAAQRAGFHVE